MWYCCLRTPWRRTIKNSIRIPPPRRRPTCTARASRPPPPVCARHTALTLGSRGTPLERTAGMADEGMLRCSWGEDGACNLRGVALCDWWEAKSNVARAAFLRANNRPVRRGDGAGGHRLLLRPGRGGRAGGGRRATARCGGAGRCGRGRRRRVSHFRVIGKLIFTYIHSRGVTDRAGTCAHMACETQHNIRND